MTYKQRLAAALTFWSVRGYRVEIWRSGQKIAAPFWEPMCSHKRPRQAYLHYHSCWGSIQKRITARRWFGLKPRATIICKLHGEPEQRFLTAHETRGISREMRA